jgi:mannosylglycerate hydrolase
MDNTTDPQPAREITIVSHTHWDRAWYVTFQEFRVRLVRLVDRLLRLLENNPHYRVFMLDGQMAVLEDYLEVRPQRQPEIERLCREGRLKVGPWYVLADEFLVSPEALIRNLQLGHEIGLGYGGVSKIGYVPDGFGHIAQLPQILRGFGIDNAFFWRGLGEEGERLGTEFTWKAPDGSAVTTIWMPYGYHNISNLGYGIHWGDTSQMLFDNELALEQIQKAIDLLQPRARTNTLLLMNGIDHEEAEPRLPEIVDLANQQLAPHTYSHGTLEEHLAQVRATRPRLEEFQGEFRWGKYSEILQGVYATRIHLKQANQRIETLYERYAEPLAAAAWLSGAEVPEGTQDLLWTGWRWLLKNHPHDDIYGSGIDAVHEEMLYRFEQAEQIGKILVRDSLRQLASRIDFSRQPGMPILIWNPLGWERRETVVGEIDFEFDDPCACNFQVVDASGNVLPSQVLQDEEVFWMETLKANRKRRVRVAFPVDAPACGYATVFVQQARQQPAETSAQTDLKIITNGAENNYLRFEIAPDGGLDVLDKLSGASYPGLGHLEDVEDAGDEYSFCPFRESHLLTTRGQPALVRLAVQGPNLVTFEIQRQLELPESLSSDRQSRSSKTVQVPITTRVTLYRDQPGLYIETDVDNRERDHKLSASFPTDLDPNQVDVDQAFLVMSREIDLPASPSWVEDPTPLMHQRAFSDLSQGERLSTEPALSKTKDGRGLAIFNRGLPAVEVTREAGGAKMALTLLRCVGWLSRDDLWNRRVAAGPLVPTPGAQCLGSYRFEYAIFPHPGDWRQVYAWAYNYTSPLLAVRADTHEGLDLREMNITRDDPAKIQSLPWRSRGVLPPQAAFLSVDRRELVLSAFTRSRQPGSEALLVRYYNISDDTLTAQLTSLLPIQEAWQADLNDRRLQALPLLDAQTLELPAGAHQVITLELHLQIPE